MGYDRQDVEVASTMFQKKTFPCVIHGRTFETEEQYFTELHEFMNGMWHLIRCPPFSPLPFIPCILEPWTKQQCSILKQPPLLSTNNCSLILSGMLSVPQWEITPIMVTKKQWLLIQFKQKSLQSIVLLLTESWTLKSQSISQSPRIASTILFTFSTTSMTLLLTTKNVMMR